MTTFSFKLVRGDDTFDLEIEATVTSHGSSGSGPSWNNPGEPPEAPEYEIESVLNTDTNLAMDIETDFTPSELVLMDEAIQIQIMESDDEPDYPEFED